MFNLGSDLNLFKQLIEMRDRQGLLRYGRACIDVLYRNYVGHDLPVTTISLVQGECLGGGFEAALSGDVIIAEKSARFGFPEILFNLFPAWALFFPRTQGRTTRSRAHHHQRQDLQRRGDAGTGRGGRCDRRRTGGSGSRRPDPAQAAQPQRAQRASRGAAARTQDRVRGTAGHRPALGRQRAASEPARPEADAAAGLSPERAGRFPADSLGGSRGAAWRSR
ncbi:MAG: hypothetical protein KIT18_01995 [Burkholderiales bacterium]|nr:hypothetical protein [Burkholderiales bacterium]